MNLHSSNHEAAHVKATNPKALPVEAQIRIDIDYYQNGQLLMVHIANVLACHMSEYDVAIKTLISLTLRRTTGPDAKDYITKLILALDDIAEWRAAHGGAPYAGGPRPDGLKNRHWSEPR